MVGEEESIVESIKYKLDRSYGMRLFEQELVFAIRMPKSYVQDFSKDDLNKIVEKIKSYNTEELKRKATSIFLICEENDVELESEIFFDMLREMDVGPIRKAILERKSTVSQASGDPKIKKIIDDISTIASKSILENPLKGGRVQGMRSTARSRGRAVGYKPMRSEDMSELAILPTIRSAAMSKKIKRDPETKRIQIPRESFMEKVKKSRIPVFVCIVVDASGSLPIEIRESRTIPIVLTILKAAYERRDSVSVVTFSGDKANTLLSFTTDVEYANQLVRSIHFGGLTPLASGIMTGLTLLRKKIGDRATAVPIMIVLTNGKTNVPLEHGGNIRRELTTVCRMVRVYNIKSLFIDTSIHGSIRVRELAMLCGGKYYHPLFAGYEESKKCHSCGKNVSDKWVRCMYCGARLELNA